MDVFEKMEKSHRRWLQAQTERPAEIDEADWQQRLKAYDVAGPTETADVAPSRYSAAERLAIFIQTGRRVR